MPRSAVAVIDLSVVAVSYNTAESLPVALEGVPEAAGSRQYEIVVVDNGSADDSVERLAALPRTRVVELGRNTGFTHAANIGADEATGTYLVFLNPDITLSRGSLEKLILAMEARDGIGACTPVFLNPDGTGQDFWRRRPGAISSFFCFTHRGRWLDRTILGGRVGARHRYARRRPGEDMIIDCVGAACLVVRRELFRSLGGFDERYFNFFQDTDLERALRKEGLAVLGVGSVAVVHTLGVTFRRLPPAEVHAQFLFGLRQYLAGEPWFRRWAGELAVRLELCARGPDREVLRKALRPLSPGPWPPDGPRAAPA